MSPLRNRPPRKRASLFGRKLSLAAAADQLHLQRPSAPPTLLPSTRYELPTTEIRQLNTSRLLPARYSDSVLTRIADSAEDLNLIYALDSATNERLLAEANNRAPWIKARELVFDTPYARIVNAAFAHPHPQGARFSTPYRGAWYAGFELATAKAEVLFHRSVQLMEINWQGEEKLDYDHYYADFSGAFHDLRTTAASASKNSAKAAEQREEWLDPSSYIASQQLAVELLEAGSLGVIYPGTRRQGGTCIACFRPSLVANVRKRDLHRLTWRPDAPPAFTRVARNSPEPSKPLLAPSQDRGETK